MKNKLGMIRGTEGTTSKSDRPAPLQQVNYYLSARVDNGIRIACPFCSNADEFEEYRHNTEEEKQFYRCLQCEGTFDFTVVDMSKPPTPPSGLRARRRRRRR